MPRILQTTINSHFKVVILILTLTFAGFDFIPPIMSKIDIRKFDILKNFQIKRLFLVFFSLQCWFKLSGQIEQNLNFQTRFSQIGLRLDKNWTEKKLLRISPELLWCHFFSEILNKNFTPKMGYFGFF